MKDIEKEIIRIFEIPVVSYKKFGRPKARFFGYLSVAWILLSFVPFFVMCSSGIDKDLFVFVFLVIPLPIFIALTIYFGLTEKPREFEEHHINQNDGKLFFSKK